MKQLKIYTLLIIILTFISACASIKGTTDVKELSSNKHAEKSKQNTDKSKRTPVLVELFTSEGCSSCPPADRAIAKLKLEQPVENADIIVLAFHVDYWDYLGWKDRFSSAKYSQRQAEYTRAFNADSSYTPQMVVDGKYEFVGSRFAKALEEIGRSAKDKKAAIKINLNRELLNPSIKVEISELNSREDSDVWLAISEDKLTSDVKRGENKGKGLTHISVVRDLQQIGYVATGEEKFEFEKTLKLNADWKKENLNFVVFVQNKNSKNIVAVGKAKLY